MSRPKVVTAKEFKLPEVPQAENQHAIRQRTKTAGNRSKTPTRLPLIKIANQTDERDVSSRQGESSGNKLITLTKVKSAVKQWKRRSRRRTSLDQKGLMLGSNFQIEIDDSEDSHLSLHDIVRSSQLADKDIELTQKIRDECGWWEKADYMNEPIDWSNREQVHTRVRESGGITWNKDRNKQQQYKRVLDAARSRVETNMKRSQLRAAKSQKLQELLPSIHNRVPDEVRQEMTSRRTRKSQPTPPLTKVQQKYSNTGGLLSRDMANSYYTIFQHKESLYDAEGASQPTTYQRLTSLKAERDLYADLEHEDGTHTSRKDIAPTPLLRKDVTSIGSLDIRRHYLENNDYYCPSVEKLVNKLVRQTGRRTRAESSEKSPSFRRTGRVAVTRKSNGRRKFKFVRMSEEEISAERRLEESNREQLMSKLRRDSDYPCRLRRDSKCLSSNISSNLASMTNQRN